MKKAFLIVFFHLLCLSSFSRELYATIKAELPCINQIQCPKTPEFRESYRLAKIAINNLGFFTERQQDSLKNQGLTITTRIPTWSFHRISIDRGFVIPHHDDMYHLYRPVVSFQHQYLRSFDDPRKRLGIMTYIAHLGTPTLGTGISFSLNVERQLLARKKNANLRIGFAMGLGLISNPYDVKSNLANRAIGSMGNAFGQIYLEHSQLLTQSIAMHLGLRLSHFSNGAWKAPNLGINIPSLSLGLSKQINAKALISGEVSSHRWNPFVSLRTGRKSIDIDDSRGFWVPVVELGVDRYLSSISSLRLAIVTHADPFYRFEKFEALPDFTLQNGIDAGLSVGYHQRFGNWGMLFDLGWYLYKPDWGYKTPYFEALGISYRLNKNFTILGRLKANKTTADLIEMGLVYYLH